MTEFEGPDLEGLKTEVEKSVLSAQQILTLLGPVNPVSQSANRESAFGGGNGKTPLQPNSRH